MKRLLALVLVLTLVLCLFTGCRQSQESADSGTQTAANGTEKGTKAPDNTGKSGKDTLVVAVNSGPADLDPHGSTDQNTYDVRYQIYEALVYVDAAGDVCPQLATDLTWEDPYTLLLTLRKDVKFSNGSDFTAEDVMYSLRRAANSSFASSYLEYVDLDASTITDDGNVRLVVTQPVGALTSRLALVMMIDKETWESNGEEYMLEHPVGTGAYTLVEWVDGDRLDFTANENYWGGAPYFKNLTMRIISESASRALEIEAGTVDVSLQVQSADLSVLESNSDVQLNISPAYMITYLGYDCSIAPYNDVRVRQALSYALDRTAICDLVYGELATPATVGRLSEVYWGYAGDVLPHVEQNVEKAKELLTDAGYADGFTMKLLVSEAEQDQMDMSELIQNQLGAIGVSVEIEVMENATYLDTIVEGGFEAFLCNSSGSSADPGEAFKSFISTRPTWSNTTRYINEDLTNMIIEGQQMVDETEKYEQFLEIQRIVAEECPWVFIAHNCTAFATRTDIQGLHVYPSYAHFFKEAYMN